MRDFISTFDNALSSKECEQIITYFESFKEYDKKEKAYKKEEREHGEKRETSRHRETERLGRDRDGRGILRESERDRERKR